MARPDGVASGRQNTYNAADAPGGWGEGDTHRTATGNEERDLRLATEDDFDTDLDDTAEGELDVDDDLEIDEDLDVLDDDEDEDDGADDIDEVVGDDDVVADEEDEDDDVADEEEDDEDEEESLEVLLGRDDDDEDVLRAVDPAGDRTKARVAIDEGEFTCRSCFLVKRKAQMADPKRLICLDCA